MDSHENTSPPEGSSPFIAATNPPVEKNVNSTSQLPDDLLTPGPKIAQNLSKKKIKMKKLQKKN